jgi:hypothetical protein
MTIFCGTCGSPLNDTAVFCGGCGTKTPTASAAAATAAFTPAPAYTSAPAAYTPAPAANTPAPVAYAPAPVAYAPAPVAYAPGNPSVSAVPKKLSTLLKVAIAAVVILFVGGVLAFAAIYYAAQKVSEKAHAVTAQVLGGNPSTASGLTGLLNGVSGNNGAGSDQGFKGDPCRFLSKEDVSQAVGVQVIRTESKDDSCSYIAKGDPADVTAKHMSSMIGGLGADAQTQKTIQKIAGGFFAQQEANDKDLSAEAATGEVPVLVVGFTSGNAAMEMKMNRGAFQHISGGGSAATTASGDLSGIGDEAYVAGGSMIMVRKGNVMARFMYVSCPCGTENIKPLVQKLASQL